MDWHAWQNSSLLAVHASRWHQEGNMLPPPHPPQITLDPCTVLQPHTHPHSEFIFTIKGGSA